MSRCLWFAALAISNSATTRTPRLQFPMQITERKRPLERSSGTSTSTSSLQCTVIRYLHLLSTNGTFPELLGSFSIFKLFIIANIVSFSRNTGIPSKRSLQARTFKKIYFDALLPFGHTCQNDHDKYSFRISLERLQCAVIREKRLLT
jgi:hypothetical protein